MTKKKINLIIIASLLFSISTVAANDANAMENIKPPITVKNDESLNEADIKLKKICKKIKNEIKKKLIKEYEYSELPNDKLKSLSEYYDKNINYIDEILKDLKDNNKIKKNKLDILINILDQTIHKEKPNNNISKNDINLKTNEYENFIIFDKEKKNELIQPLEKAKEFSITKKDELSEYIKKSNLGRTIITQQNIDDYEKKIQTLMKNFKGNIEHIKEIWIFENKKINFNNLMKVFKNLKIIENKNDTCYIEKKLKNSLESYLNQINHTINLYAKILKNDKSNSYNSSKKFEINIDEKIDEILNKKLNIVCNTINDIIENKINKIKRKLDDTTNSKDTCKIFKNEKYEEFFASAIFLLSLNPNNKLNKLNLAGRIQNNLIPHKDINIIKCKNKNIADIISEFIEKNHNSIHTRLLGLKNKLNKTFDDIKNIIINKFKNDIKKNKIKNDANVIYGYETFLNLYINNLTAKMAAYKYMNLKIDIKENIEEFLAELTQSYQNILNNMCLTNTNKIRINKEKFEENIKKIGLLNDDNINYYNIDELEEKNYETCVKIFLNLKNSLKTTIKDFTEKYKFTKSAFDKIQNTNKNNEKYGYIFKLFENIDKEFDEDEEYEKKFDDFKIKIIINDSNKEKYKSKITIMLTNLKEILSDIQKDIKNNNNDISKILPQFITTIEILQETLDEIKQIYENLEKHLSQEEKEEYNEKIKEITKFLESDYVKNLEKKESIQLDQI